MKFTSKFNANLFLSEIGRHDIVGTVDENFHPDPDMMEAYFKKKRDHESMFPDFRKAQNAKRQWKNTRGSMLSGIHSYHKSTDGKRNHRSLSRFLTMKDMDQKGSNRITERVEVLKALSSVRTRLFIEAGYFHPMQEQLVFERFLEHALEMLTSIETKIMDCTTLSEDDMSFLFDITGSSALIKTLSEMAKSEEGVIEQMWSNKKSELMEGGLKEDHDSFYPTLVSALKKELNLE